jgi:D-amino-acid oxidase
MQITVVGAGVIGLTTAVTLEEHGHDVQVVAAGRGIETTSAIAGAVWFPYRAGPPDKVARWAATTRRWLVQIARAAPEAGVDVLTGYEITTEATSPPPRPWWAAIPTMEGDDLALDIADVERVPSPVAGSPDAWRFTAPRAQPSHFLPYLESRLRRPIERRLVADLAREPGDIVVNCTGLAARELVGDDLLLPLLGQILIAERGDADPATTITDDRDHEEIFYIIPRRDELVLGGCSLPFPPGATPELDPAISERILAHARRLGIPIGSTRTERVGLRPFRAEVRLERDPRDARIVHNYGHGGAGFTLCRGCAEEVAALVAGQPTRPLK